MATAVPTSTTDDDPRSPDPPHTLASPPLTAPTT
eukprot:CAMPEP_0119539562 /NCGR_PEP_ID=MMETSP1344-20130328/51677_1 /TAXON_ID=236787 /ORGANISM="Florenciella parvula, Strain CCMP2471" /LENGTH=33 /DNA_ID= /DNA_START= /DNA_END= /DNA_ORIENTATION=